MDGTASTAADRGERERAVADNKLWINAAAALGSPSIRTHIASADNQPPDLDRSTDTLLRIVEHAVTRNVVIHLENDDGVTEDPVFLVKLIEKVNNPWLRGLPDFGNSLCIRLPKMHTPGSKPCLTTPTASAMSNNRRQPKKGPMYRWTWPYVFAILKRTGFRGYLSMEYDASGDPYKETEELIAKSLQFLS